MSCLVWTFTTYYILGQKRNTGYIVYATNNKHTRYWRASQCYPTQIGVLFGCFFFSKNCHCKIEWNFVNLFNKVVRLYKNKKVECNITLNTLKLSVKVIWCFFYVLVYKTFQIENDLMTYMISIDLYQPAPLCSLVRLYTGYKHSIWLRNTWKKSLCNLRTMEALISLGECPGWSVPSLSTYRINGYCSICWQTDFLDQTAWICMLIWTFTVRIWHKGLFFTLPIIWTFNILSVNSTMYLP